MSGLQKFLVFLVVVGVITAITVLAVLYNKEKEKKECEKCEKCEDDKKCEECEDDKKCEELTLTHTPTPAPANPPEVYQISLNGGWYDEIPEDLSEIYNALNARLATKGELITAQQNGAQWCSSGLLDDRKDIRAWPMQDVWKGPGCGNPNSVPEWWPENKHGNITLFGVKPSPDQYPSCNSKIPSCQGNYPGCATGSHQHLCDKSKPLCTGKQPLSDKLKDRICILPFYNPIEDDPKLKWSQFD